MVTYDVYMGSLLVCCLCRMFTVPIEIHHSKFKTRTLRPYRGGWFL